MQGLAGIVYPDVFQTEQLIHPMLDTIAYRGESGSDVYNFKNIQLGTCGGKIYFNEKKTVAAAVDGEITNVNELKDELKKHGHHLTNQATSAEILAHAYDLWGTELFTHITGDFALFILDQQKEKIFIARDRIGKKPLYWYHDGKFFIFGSEIKALLATNLIPQTPATDSLASYLYFGYIPQDMTPISGVNKLIPGYYLQLNKDRSIHIQSYWSYSSFFEQRSTSHKVTIVRTLDELLNKATKARIPKKTNLGCFISGGLGSACIAHYVKKNCENANITGFTVGFEGENEADLLAAADVAHSLGIPQEIAKITPQNFLEDLVQIAWHLDEPIADPNIVAIWKMSKLSSETTKRVYSGMGSDELLAGHSRYTSQESEVSFLDRMIQPPLYMMRRALIPLFNFFNSDLAFEMLKDNRNNPWQFEYVRQNALFDETVLKRAAPNLAGLFDSEVFLHKFHNLSRIKSTVSSLLYFDVKTRLVDCFVLELERATAAHGQEWSAPFLDRFLVEYLATLPEPDQLDEKETALWLKALLKNVFPDYVLNRPKRTRRDFLKKWSNRPEITEIFKLLPKGTLVESGLINEAWINVHLETPQSREESFRHLWAILMLEIWFRLFINRPIGKEAPDITAYELLSETF